MHKLLIMKMAEAAQQMDSRLPTTADHVILMPTPHRKPARTSFVTPLFLFLAFMTFAFMAAGSTWGCGKGPEFIAHLSDVTFSVEEVHLWGARYLPRDYETAGRWFSPALVHASFDHLMLNAVFLAVCGVVYERTAGMWRGLLVFTMATVGSGFFSAAFESPCLTFLGMSGICFGLAGAVITRTVHSALWGDPLPFPRVLPNLTWWLIVAGELFLLFGALIEPVILKTSDVSHMTHLGGFMAGQAVSLITEWWPSKWRPLSYSIALIETLILFVVSPALVYTSVLEAARVC